MTPMLSRSRLRRLGPALACCTLALLVSALRPPAAAAVPAGVPLAWGANDRGQLGNGTFTDSAVPSPVSNLAGVVAVASRHNHSLALQADGAVWAWGENTHGQLGDGTTALRTTPVPVTNLTGIVAIAGARTSSLALKADGTVWAWGDNTYGQLGIGTFGGYRTTPVRVSNLTGVVAIAADGHSLALKADGTVWSWGLNDSGQLGDGTFANRSRPVRVINLPSVRAIASGSNHGLALTPEGTVWTWGRNDVGQLGDGTFNSRATPAPVPNLSGVVAVADSASWSIALKDDGTVWTWGRNSAGQLGQGTVNPDPGIDGVTNVPGQVVNADGTVFDGVVAIAMNRRAVKSDGTVWAWGQNLHGQIGDGYTYPYSANPVQGVGLSTPVALDGGSSHNVAVDLAAEYFLQLLDPVNADGTSVFKKGSTVELRLQLTGPSAGITDAQARFGYAQIDSLDPGAVNESVSNAPATAGILFQYDAASGEYRYNWRTTGLGRGRYLLRIDMGDGVMRTVVVGLK